MTVGLVKEKAIDVAKALVEQYKDADIEIQNKLHLAKLREFAASAQWYKNFARRFGLNTGKQAGVFLISVSVVGSASLILLCFCFMKVRLPPVDLEVVSQAQTDFQAIFKDYQPDDIFNLDEFALFWKLLPDRFNLFDPVSLSCSLPPFVGFLVLVFVLAEVLCCQVKRGGQSDPSLESLEFSSPIWAELKSEHLSWSARQSALGAGQTSSLNLCLWNTYILAKRGWLATFFSKFLWISTQQWRSKIGRLSWSWMALVMLTFWLLFIYLALLHAFVCFLFR